MVVAFGLQHEKLGEVVAGAVVLAEGQSVNEKDLRAVALQKLADFKVPKVVVFMDEIPKGATGKMQRIGMAQKLGLVDEEEKGAVGTKICVFGAEAIGGHSRAKLALAGAQVSLSARGPHLTAMRENGLTLLEGEDQSKTNVKVVVSDNPADLDPQDYIIVTLKAHFVPPVVQNCSPSLGRIRQLTAV